MVGALQTDFHELITDIQINMFQQKNWFYAIFLKLWTPPFNKLQNALRGEIFYDNIILN